MNSARARPHRASVLYMVDIRQDDKWNYWIGSAYNFRDTDFIIGGGGESEPSWLNCRTRQ